MMCNNPDLDLVNISASTIFDQTLSIRSQDIEWKQFATSIMDLNSVTHLQKMTHNNPILDLDNINEHNKNMEHQNHRITTGQG